MTRHDAAASRASESSAPRAARGVSWRGDDDERWRAIIREGAARRLVVLATHVGSLSHRERYGHVDGASSPNRSTSPGVTRDEAHEVPPADRSPLRGGSGWA